MKQSKRILCLLMTIVLCLLLTSCNELDEMRATHAIKQEDGIILWNGYTYRMLDEYYGEFRVNDDDFVYVTDPEVPLLFSRIEGRYHSVSANGLLIGGGNYAEDTVFCREDYCEWVQSAHGGNFEVQSYGCEVWHDTGEYKTLHLSQEERESIDRILATTPTYKEPAGLQHCFNIFGYSQYDMFYVVICFVSWDGNSYVLHTETETEDGLLFEYFRVPESEWPLLDKMNGERPEEFIPTVEEEPIYTTRSSVPTIVSTKRPTTTTTVSTTPTTTATSVKPPQFIVP